MKKYLAVNVYPSSKHGTCRYVEKGKLFQKVHKTGNGFVIIQWTNQPSHRN